MIKGFTVIIFGSAAEYLLSSDSVYPKPRDIDVAWTQEDWKETTSFYEEKVRKIVKEYLSNHLELELANLNFDLHYTYVTNNNEVRLPRPFEKETQAIQIHGEKVGIKWESHTGLASAIRAFGHNADLLKSVLLEGQHKYDPNSWTLSLKKANNCQWDENYCDGLTALKSALTHTLPGVWEQAVKGIPHLEFIDSLLKRGVKKSGVILAGKHSSGSQGSRIFVGSKGIWCQYGKDYKSPWTVEEARELFIKHLPILLNVTVTTGLPDFDEEFDYSLVRLKPETAKDLIKEGFTSYVGHEATAKAMSTILGVDVPLSREQAKQKEGQDAICLKIRGRLPEGKILNEQELEEIGYDLFLLKRTS